MKIYFADLNYMSTTHFSHPLPLNAGLIVGYTLKHIPDLDCRIFKHPGELLDAVSESPPDVLALTNYSWNANLNRAVTKRCKQYHPDLLVVMGGPNFPVGDREWMEMFFRNNPLLNLYITGEGETNFLSFIQLLLKSDADLRRTEVADWPSTFYGFDHDANQLLHNSGNPVERIDVTELPSPYLSGLLDPFLDNEHLLPIIETNRGCPYTCAYCVWGQATNSKVRQFDLQTVIDEIFYIGERSANRTKVLMMTDANFGILRRDKAIAEAMMECRDKYGFPERLYVFTHKQPKLHTIETFEILSPIADMSMSLQSTNENVLKNIGRENLNIENYEKVRAECNRRGMRTTCDMIYGLPGESYESFVNGMSWVLRTGQRIELYAHLIIWGAETATRKFIQKHGFKTAFRVQTDTGRSYRDIHALEYEEIVVASNDMTREDFLRLREFHFFVSLFGSHVFTEFQCALKVIDKDIAMFSNLILKDELKWPRKWVALMACFRQACRDELLNADDLKTEFTDKDIQEIQEREVNLCPSFMCKLFAHRANVQELRDYLVGAFFRFFKEELSDEEIEDICQALDVSIDRAVCYDDLQPGRTIEYCYDLDSWLSTEPLLPLREFKTKSQITYRLDLYDGLIEAFQRAKSVGSSLENSVYLLKYRFFPLSSDRIFFYKRQRLNNR